MKNSAHDIMKALFLAVSDEVSANTLKDVLSKPLEEHKDVLSKALEEHTSFINSLSQIQRAHNVELEDDHLDKPVLARNRATLGLGKK